MAVSGSSLSQALGANALSSNQSAAAGAQLSKTFDTFLKLLTAQLQHQDPLKPMESSEFTQQLVAYSQVEQQINTNKKLETMVSNMEATQFASAVGYIGKTVDAVGNTITLKETGSGEWGYELQGTATRTQLTINDASGRAVLVRDGNTTAGKHSFTWDGKDAAGNRLPAGKYSLTVSALDRDTKPVTSITSITGQVEGVETADGVHRLLIGGQSIPLADVTKVRLSATN
jgi:flagellar basal-body rod modification protein FlgD